MSFATIPSAARPRRSLALRLSLWYAFIFALTSALAFSGAYALITRALTERADEELRQDLDEYAAHWRQDGINGVTKEMALDTQGEDASKSYFRLWGSDGRQLVTTNLQAWPALARGSPWLDAGEGPEPVFKTRAQVLPATAPMRTLVGSIGPGVWLEIGRSLEEEQGLLREVLRGFVFSLAGVLLLGIPIGWFMARRALHGVVDVTRTAQQIADGAFERRVPVGAAGDEVDELARTFNAMLDRIQALVVGVRDMADNLAHDLRSPLARIRACAEMNLVNNRANSATNRGEARAISGDARVAAAADDWAVGIIEECDRLLEMLNLTLDIAEADSGAARLNLVAVDLGQMVLTACELFQSAAEDRQVSIVTSVAGPCWIEVDRQRLQRVISNLLDNALKYTAAGGEVRVALREQASRVLLSIEDTGAGIAAHDLPHIFQRFYRCETSRSGPGIGLGLSLAKAFVRAHGGDITVTSTPGRGSQFTVALPRPARAAATPEMGAAPVLAGSN